MHLLESSPKHSSKYTTPFEILVSTNTTHVPSTIKALELELKQLLEHLTYAYWCTNFIVLASAQVVCSKACASTRSNPQGVVFAKINSLPKLTIS
jgi:hypothetical protein